MNVMTKSVAAELGFQPAVDNDVPIDGIRQFLGHEAELLDDMRRLREWSGLLTEDFSYEVPVRVFRTLHSKEPSFPKGSLAVYEDRRSIELRVVRLESGQAHGEEIPPLMRRLVNGVRAVRIDDQNFAVRSAFHLYHNRRTVDGEIVAGEREDIVRICNGRYYLARRIVLLDHIIIPTQNITIFF